MSKKKVNKGIDEEISLLYVYVSKIINRHEANMFPVQHICNNVKEVCVFYFCFCAFIEYHYGRDGFFGETVGQKYMLHRPFIYGVKCLEEV